MNVHRSFIHNSKTWKQSKCPLTRQWLYKLRSLYTLIHATPCMNVQDIALCKISQSDKITSCMIPYMWHSWNDKAIQRSHIISFCQGIKTGWKYKGVTWGTFMMMKYLCILSVVMIPWISIWNKIAQDDTHIHICTHAVINTCKKLVKTE